MCECDVYVSVCVRGINHTVHVVVLQCVNVAKRMQSSFNGCIPQLPHKSSYTYT